jgi:hypothetical protein
MNNWSRLLLCIVLGLSSASCVAFTAHPSAAVPLDIPDPPAHSTIPPVQVAEKPQPEPAAPPAAENPGGRSGRPVASPAARPPVTPPQAATPIPGPPPAVSTPPPPAAPAAATELRPAGPSGAQTLSAQQVREIMTRTEQKLSALDRRKLTAGKRDDYEAARRFLSQADTAVKANDLLLAQSSAEKAEALANGLR